MNTAFSWFEKIKSKGIIKNKKRTKYQKNKRKHFHNNNKKKNKS